MKFKISLADGIRKLKLLSSFLNNFYNLQNITMHILHHHLSQENIQPNKPLSLMESCYNISSAWILRITSNILEKITSRLCSGNMTHFGDCMLLHQLWSWTYIRCRASETGTLPGLGHFHFFPRNESFTHQRLHIMATLLSFL